MNPEWYLSRIDEEMGVEGGGLRWGKENSSLQKNASNKCRKKITELESHHFVTPICKIWFKQKLSTYAKAIRWKVVQKQKTHLVSEYYPKDYLAMQREKCIFKMERSALAGVAQLVGALSHNWKVIGSIPSQGTHLDCSFKPQPGCI